MLFTPRLRMTVRMIVGVIAAAGVSFGCDSGASSMENDGSLRNTEFTALRQRDEHGWATTYEHQSCYCPGRAADRVLDFSRQDGVERASRFLAGPVSGHRWDSL